jgi:hypothetical protein
MSRIILPPGYRQRERGFIINPYAYASAGGASDTNALLHFNGSAGGTTFTDEYGSTWSRWATATTETSGSPSSAKFGSGYLRTWTGASTLGGIYTNNDALTNFGASDFSIDFWSYLTSYYGSDGSTNPYWLWGGISATPAYPSIALYHFNFSQISVYISYNGTGWVGGGAVITSPTSTISQINWQHIEVSRTGSNLYLFVGGVQKGSTYNIGSNALVDTEGFTFGGVYTGNYSMTGALDELRIIRGTGGHTSGFTPPSSAYSPP